MKRRILRARYARATLWTPLAQNPESAPEPGGMLVREKLSKKTLSLVSSIITMLLRTGHHHYYYYLHSGKLLHTLGTSPLKRWKPLKKLAAVVVALAL